MSTQTAQLQLALQAQIAEAQKRIAGLEGKLRALDELVVSIANERQQYQILADICDALEKLGTMGAAELFWAGHSNGAAPEQRLRQLRLTVTEFQQKTAAIEQSRHSLQDGIQEQSDNIRLLHKRLEEAQADVRRAKYKYAVERAPGKLSHRLTIIMPWSKQGEDERLFHAILAAFFVFSIALIGLASLWKVPPPDRDKEAVIPERLARLVKKIQSKPPEPKPEEKKKEEKPEEKKEEKKEDQAAARKPLTAETKRARAKAETKGVLAFKDNIADLMQDATPVKLGANARISGNGRQGSGAASQRSIIVAQGGSGGINTSGLSRQSMGGGGQGITSAGLKIARVESVTGVDLREADRPLSKGVGPSRTDEDIQIVFDRYKSALYRIYNRELRNDPSLRGKMVLRITIEPDGRVSACAVKSTDLASATLSTDIVERVLKFNFGSKEGVPAVTILYPIDFLPAT